MLCHLLNAHRHQPLISPQHLPLLCPPLLCPPLPLLPHLLQPLSQQHHGLLGKLHRKLGQQELDQ
jgi:hypothetical protein